jgi:quinol monooxygenase YgiN
MTIVVKVRPEKREEFLQAVRSLNNGPEKQQGLRKSTIYQEIDDQTGFSLIYEWEMQEDCERYLGAEKFKVLLGALKVLCENSEIRCSDISGKLPNLACRASIQLQGDDS